MRKLPDSLVRLLIVIAGLASVVLCIRFLVLPRSLTDMELHKQSAVERELEKPIQFAGSGICQECHEDEPATLAAGYHSTLSCETCHGPAQAHIDDFEYKPKAPRQRDFCPVCHMYDPSRPTGFPQINPIAHNPLLPCIECHDPHDPVPPETPRSCEACHAEIARMKAVSHHVQLECKVCHEATNEHMLHPRAEKPTKPANREFCGSCHAEDSDTVATPHIDLKTHGGRYLCWQCHYPHFPEAS
ncbi:MAG: hypothetical protein JSU96_16515 [Acidobacteriota bacterium]|nr:MAG: hypothetical protein JSU96_16515 [Acidobacteriota bacterium]